MIFRSSARSISYLARRLSIALLAGAAATTANAALAPKPDLPGRELMVDGHAMYIHCSGHGSPTVVLDAGLGDSDLVWSRVQPRLARVTRVCSYDRPGYGRSAAMPQPRTSDVIVRELHRLLSAAEIAPPYVLVGHSFGGWNMQLFARRYPNAIAGLVLVDSSQAHQIERYRDELGENIAPTGRGEYHLTVAPYVPPNLPFEVAERARALAYNPQTWRTTYSELLGFRTSEHELQQANALPDVPLIVISRGRPISDPNGAGVRSERLWRRIQQAFVDEHAGAIHLIARRSGHYIQLEQPELVVYGVCRALHPAAADRLCTPAATAPPVQATANTHDPRESARR